MQRQILSVTPLKTKPYKVTQSCNEKSYLIRLKLYKQLIYSLRYKEGQNVKIEIRYYHLRWKVEYWIKKSKGI